MIIFQEIADDHPALDGSPLVRAIRKTAGYIAEHGSIGLTPSKAFKRNFVDWAAAEFEWPGYSSEELYSVNKALNEMDFPPLMDIHDLLIALKIGRHRKGKFTLTKYGRELIDHPGKMFGVVTPFYLFEMDHERFARRHEKVFGNWDVFLNVLNVEAENGAAGSEIRTTLYGAPDNDQAFDTTLSSFYIQVLRPLCWVGLMHETRASGPSSKDAVYMKSPLWNAALQLETDAYLTGADAETLLRLRTNFQ